MSLELTTLTSLSIHITSTAVGISYPSRHNVLTQPTHTYDHPSHRHTIGAEPHHIDNTTGVLHHIDTHFFFFSDPESLNDTNTLNLDFDLISTGCVGTGMYFSGLHKFRPGGGVVHFTVPHDPLTT